METYVFLCTQFRTDLRTPAELRALKITQASSREKLAWEVEERARGKHANPKELCENPNIYYRTKKS